jgi:hypothetical protein
MLIQLLLLDKTAQHVKPNLVLIREFGLFLCAITLSKIAQQDNPNNKFFIVVYHKY